jgi:three-Cys-motif partner protein
MVDLPVPTDDGLCIPEVGEWSKDKHYYLSRYIHGFTTAMKDKKWGGLHYIDLFAGAGIERLKKSQTLEWGSPLIAAQATYPFDGLHFCDKDKEKHEALKKRVQKIRPDAQILLGDVNKRINEIVRGIPDRALSLAFIDPYGLHLEFETLKILSQKRADLIIFFPDHLDVLRNWKKYYLENPDSNLDRCLGKQADWRALTKKIPPDRLGEKLQELYIQQIKSLGYTEFEYERIYNQNKPLYRLIFCARHKAASKIWRGISGKKHNGQRSFDFGE